MDGDLLLRLEIRLLISRAARGAVNGRPFAVPVTITMSRAWNGRQLSWTGATIAVTVLAGPVETVLLHCLRRRPR